MSDKNWIQKATKNMRKDKPCTGEKFGSETCPPGSKRYNLAKTFRKMAKEGHKLASLEKASVLSASDDPKDQDKAREIRVRHDYESLKKQIGSKKRPTKPAVSEAKVDKGRSDYGKATIRNWRHSGPSTVEPAMFDPENKRGKTIEKRREEHKARRGVKGAKVPTYKKEEVEIEEGKKKGLWDNIHAKRKRGEKPAKPGDKDYPKTLNVEGLKQARKNVGADTCWDGYKAKGTKKKGGKEVPNCVKEDGVNEGAAWTKKSGKNPEGGLNEKGRKSYERENPGSDLKAPQPEGGSRKKSFCARMGGMKKKLTSAKTANDPDSRINKALRKWKCNETVAGGVPLTPQELEIQKKMSKLNVRLARKRNQQMSKAKVDDTESSPEQVKEEDKAFNTVVAALRKKHGKDAVLTKDSPKPKPPTEAQKKKAAAERKKRQDADNKAYAARARKAGFKSTQDYTNVVARYGSEDNYRKGKGLGT